VEVTAEGTNGSVAGGTETIAITKENGATAGTLTPGSPTEITNAMTFGSSVTAVSVVPSPVLANASSNYLVSFTAGTTGTPPTYASARPTMARCSQMSPVLLSLTQPVAGSTSWRLSCMPLPERSCGGNYGLCLELAGQTIKSGDAVTVLLAGLLTQPPRP